MSKTIKAKLQPPIHYTKEEFINSHSEQEVLIIEKGRSQAVTFTLNEQDIQVLDHEIDRAIKLGRRNKSKSATIRMALRALKDSSDDKYLDLYNKF